MRNTIKGKTVILFCIIFILSSSIPNAFGSTMEKTDNRTTFYSSWSQVTKLLPGDGSSGDYFGSVSFDGNTAFIGSPKDDDNGGDSGSVYVFTNTSGTWVQNQKLVASDGAAGDWFGVSVSVCGDTALIGAPFDDDVGVNSGTVFVFTRNGGTWSQQAKLHAFDGYDSDLFGFSVSINEDQVFVGAAGKNDARGAGYGFLRQGTEWIEEGKATASDGASSDCFGWSVDLNGDTVVIGAIYHDDQGTDSGSAYVFTKTENQPPVADFSWTPQNPPPNQQITFNASASYDSDGKIILYAWDWNNDGVYEESHSSPTATHTWATIGNYPVTLRVTDDDGATGTITKSVLIVKNDPPAPPIITGPAKGKIKTEIMYNFTTTDPNSDEVFYFIDWGDGTNSSWIGPYSSGDMIKQSHTWSKKADYTIKAKAKDSHGNESDWGTLSITMPLSYEPPHFRFLNWLLGRFPNTFPILHYLFRFN